MTDDAAKERQRQQRRVHEQHERALLRELTPTIRELFGDQATALTITYQLLYHQGVYRDLYTVTVYDHMGGPMWPPNDEETWLALSSRLITQLGPVLELRLAPRPHWSQR